VLLCISNLSELKGSAIPKIVNLFENAFEISFTDNLKVSCSRVETDGVGNNGNSEYN
jgi:hypothetical protein